MNILAMIGNVSTGPELSFTKDGMAVCSFRICVSRIGVEGADFFDVVTTDRQAEVCNEYLQVGRRIGVEGRLRYREGGVVIACNRVQLLGPGVGGKTEVEA